MRTHDKLRQREYKCTYQGCGKAFYDNQHLKQHMQTHSRPRDVDLIAVSQVVVLLPVSWLQQKVLHFWRSDSSYQESSPGRRVKRV